MQRPRPTPAQHKTAGVRLVLRVRLKFFDAWSMSRALGATAGADLPVVRGGGLLPGVDLTSNAVVQRLLDDGLPLEKLR